MLAQHDLSEFIDLQKKLIQKIQKDQWIILRNSDVPKGLKIRIIELLFGKRTLALVQSLYNWRTARKNGRRFFT